MSNCDGVIIVEKRPLQLAVSIVSAFYPINKPIKFYLKRCTSLWVSALFWWPLMWLSQAIA